MASAFVFAGGGSFGAVQVGMLRGLVAHGVVPDFVVGSSAGAINGAYFAGAPDADGVTRLDALWRGLTRSEVFPVTWRSVAGFIARRRPVVDPAGLRGLLERHLPYRDLREAAIPAAFPPVRIDGRFLVDGAVASNTPVGVAAELGAELIERAAAQTAQWLEKGGLGKHRIPGALRPHED